MITRIFAFLLLIWLLGFAWFALVLPQPAELEKTDGVVVLTGGAGRIDRGLLVLEKGKARRMLISGVDLDVKPNELAAEYKRPAKLFACCIDLGYEAVDTRSNADETARWVTSHRYRSVRLVTSDWHVARARMELAAALDRNVVILGDGVPGTPRLGTLVNEYNKLILRRIALWIGFGG